MKLLRNDQVGPLPWWAYGAILLFDIFVIVAIVSAIVGFGDWIEDFIWP